MIKICSTILKLFYSKQVITASDSAPKPLRDLRNRCLNPGKYAQHLERWLAYYPAQQLHIIDGEQLRSNPVDIMNDLQRFLKLSPIFDYSNHLRFDPKKGFFCQVVNDNRNKCLGKSKGRNYPPMDDKSMKILQRFVVIITCLILTFLLINVFFTDII
jgi:heparan sulfate N-deacetylase/N-sulfotransferase NDST2